MSILDRYIFRSLAFNYVVALAVMISLYVVLDLFVNMDEFTEEPGRPVLEVLGNIANYYGPNLFLYFAQLSGVITLFACVATVARIRRQNELTAVLASGVSLYRVAAPVLAFGVLTTTLLVLTTEFAIPTVAHLLSRNHDDVDGTKAYGVYFLPDHENALLSAAQFHPNSRDLRYFLVIERDDAGGIRQTIEAEHAVWEPPGPGEPTGRWKLSRGLARSRVERDSAGLGPRSERLDREVNSYASTLSPEAIELRQSEGWMRYLSLSDLRQLQESGLADRASIVQTRHERVAAPIVAMVLLLLGLPFFLDRSPANVLTDATKCLVVCGACYVSTIVAHSVRTEAVSALPAWIPIFVFATLAMVLLDRVRT